jgi:hypothetical protein
MSETPLSNQEPAMPDEQSTSHDTAAEDTVVQAPPQRSAYEPLAREDDDELVDDNELVEEDDEDWPETAEELPPRPRRRLLGVSGNPLPLALLGILLIACGFIGGVLVEKGQTSSSGGSTASGLASRFAALRGAGASGSPAGGSGTSSSAGDSGAGSTTGGSGGFSGGGSFAGRLGGLGGAGGATIGEVSYVSGDTLYVINSEGNTVKVSTSPASSITKTVKADVHGIHPGETVIVRGSKGSNGAVSAESISVSAAGAASAAGGGLASLFGGGSSGTSSGTSSPSRTGGASAGGSGGGEPALFGK